MKKQQKICRAHGSRRYRNCRECDDIYMDKLDRRTSILLIGGLILMPSVLLVLLFMGTFSIPCKDYRGPNIAMGTVVNQGGCLPKINSQPSQPRPVQIRP